jgi:hypothetical protein
MSAKKIPIFAAMACLALSRVAMAIGEDEFLPPEQAFTYTVTADEKSVSIE